jgi:GTPase
MDARHQATPVVAIVGRTNVGKSTLFNTLLGKKAAITSKTEGTTQDVKFGLCEWQAASFTLIDTAGLDMSADERTEATLRKQATKAMQTASVIIFVIDATTGILPQDVGMAKHLRTSKAQVVLVANKADNPGKRRMAEGADWARLGFGMPIAISATNGSGVGDMLDVVVERLTTLGKTSEELPAIDVRVTIIGRPNVGKSSLLNSLAGEDRVIVSDIPHTTKEPQDTLVTYEHPTDGAKHILIVDTVGMRKKANVEHGLESLGVHLSVEELRRADVAFLVIDAKDGVGAQEKKLAGLIEDKNVGVAFIVNKWDLVRGDKEEGMTADKYRDYLAKQLPSFSWAPVVFLSALTGRHVDRVLQLALTIAQERKRVIPQDELDAFFDKLKKQHGLSVKKGENKPRVFGITQTNTEPPEFTIVSRKKDTLHTNFMRFIENRLRETFGFEGVPIRIGARDITK